MKVVLCPVCNGNGLVSNGFYSHPGDYPFWVSDNVNPELCHSCNGKGLVEVAEDKFEKESRTIWDWTNGTFSSVR